MPRTDGKITSLDNVRERKEFAVVKDTHTVPPAYSTTPQAANSHMGAESFKGFAGNKKSTGMSWKGGTKGRAT